MAIFNLKILVTADDKASRKLKKNAGAIDKLASSVSQAVLTYSALRAAQQAIKFVKFGAAVQATESRFIAFAGSGERAEEMLQALGKASDGTIDRMSAMTTASTLMSLGLATTSDEMSIAGAMLGKLARQGLGAEGAMNSLTMLLANQSTRRLDDFSLSVEEVTKRQKELEDQGLSAQEAFKTAVFDTAAKKLEILGDMSELTATKIGQLESAGKSAGQIFASSFAGGLGEAITGTEDLASAIDVAAPGIRAFGLTMAAMITKNWTGVGEAWKEAGKAAFEHGKNLAQVQSDVAASAAGWQKDEDELRASLENASTAIGDQTVVLKENEEALKASQAAADAATVKQVGLAAAFFDTSQADIAKRAIGELGNLLDEDKITIDEYKQAVTETQLAFGLADQQSIWLAENVLSLTERFGEGEVKASEFDDELKAMIDIAQESRDAVAALGIAINDLPDSKTIDIKVRQTATAMPGGSTEGWGLAQAKGTYDRRQSGGPASGPTIVGERGWELADMAPGSRVYNHEQSTNIVNHFNQTVNTRATTPSVQQDYRMMQARLGA